METTEFLYLPVPDLGAAVAFYRDTLGWDESWREGETTVSLQMPGGDLKLMLDADPEGKFRPGPMVQVDDARAFHERRRDEFSFWLEPMDIPGGWLAGFEDTFGNAVYVIDQSTADASG